MHTSLSTNSLELHAGDYGKFSALSSTSTSFFNIFLKTLILSDSSIRFKNSGRPSHTSESMMHANHKYFTSII